MAAQQLAEPGRRVGADEHGHQLGADAEQPVDDGEARPTSTPRPISTTSPSMRPSTSPAWQMPGRGERLVLGDADLGEAGRGGGLGHGDDVVVEAAAGVVHRDRGQPLHR